MIFATLVLVAMMSMSCTEDFTDPKNLNGTTWRCSTFPIEEMSTLVDYYEVKFTSTTTGETYTKMKDEAATKESTFTYTVSGDKITVLVDGEKTNGVGTIVKKTLTITEGDLTFVYTKQ